MLIADDTPEKLHVMYRAAASALPRGTVIDIATSAKQALQMIGARGKEYDQALIDFDFPREDRNGEDIVRALRIRNSRAFIDCITARPLGQPFDEARDATFAAGANRATCFLQPEISGCIRALVA